MPGKTTAQWRREVPAYDQLIRAVQRLAANWPGTGSAPRIIAHLNPDTRVVSVILDGTAEECSLADQRLATLGYRPGWVFDTTVHPVWRKVVS